MREDLLNTIVSMADDDGTAVYRRTVQPGEVVIKEGEDASSVFVLLEGALDVTRSVNGEAAQLAEIEDAGSVVGEMVSMGGGTRSATVQARTAAELLEFSAVGFQRLLEGRPEFTGDLVNLAMQRADEGELVELLADHFGVVDDELLMTTCGAVQWLHLAQGEVLVEEGAESDAIYFVVRGRLEASRRDVLDDTIVELGEAGRGDVVGEMGLLGQTPRTATLTAIRDTVVARLEEGPFFGLVDRQPRLMIQVALNAIARAESRRLPTAPDVVVAVAICDRLDPDPVLSKMEAELSRFGEVGVLSSDRVDAILGAPGASEAGQGEMGGVRLSRLVHEMELASDHMILDLGGTPGSWSRRALGMADRLLIVVPADVTDEEAARLDALAKRDARDLRRTLVRVHRPGTHVPTGSARARHRFEATDVLNVEHGSAADLARVARVVAGRGTALVLGGGGARGFAHIGVLRALNELRVPVDIVGGTSIGGIIGTAIADSWPADRIVAWVAKHFPKGMDYTIPVVALTKGARIARSAEATFGDREIEDLWRTFFCVSTNLSAARVHVHRDGLITTATRATSSIPGVMPPVPDGEDLLVDGGVLNNLPMDIARGLTPLGSVIAVDVAPPRGPGSHGDYGLSVSGWDALRAAIGSGERRYPRMSAVLMRSMISASMRERDSQTSAGLADCYLDLDMRGISMLDFDDPAAVAQRGYEAARPALEEWAATL